MRRVLLILLCTALILSLGEIKSDARPQYKSAIDKLKPRTKTEKDLQVKVKTQKCNHCHNKKSKKIRTKYGLKLHNALGGGNKKKYKFDRALWKKAANGKYSPKAINLLRDAVNAAAQNK